MKKDSESVNTLKKIIENKLGWGDSSQWVNQDFIALSEKMKEKTGNSISAVTLKRLWGKINYENLPQVYTLNTLALFAGYESWRDFMVKQEGEVGSIAPQKQKEDRKIRYSIKTRTGMMALLIAGILLVLIFWPKKTPHPGAYTFTSHRTLNSGIPNSVIFDFNATSAPGDSVIIQQSWDTRLRRKVSKYDRQASLIYYFPGFFNPKLIVNNVVVKELGILIPSNGWIAALLEKETPVYFKKEDVMKDGVMTLSLDRIKAQGIALAPHPPVLSFCNVRDFGEIYTDDFEFETSVKNDYHGESAVCQMTNIYLLCQGTAVNIPLCSKGCESALDFYFTSYKAPGKKSDLSAFGVDFKSFVKVKIQSKAGKARIYLNGKLAYAVDHGIMRSKIIGIDIAFHGTGSVDYVKLKNQNLAYSDNF